LLFSALSATVLGNPRDLSLCSPPVWAKSQNAEAAENPAEFAAKKLPDDTLHCGQQPDRSNLLTKSVRQATRMTMQYAAEFSNQDSVLR